MRKEEEGGTNTSRCPTNWVTRHAIVLLALICLLMAFKAFYRISDTILWHPDAGLELFETKHMWDTQNWLQMGPRISTGGWRQFPHHYYLILPAALISQWDPVGPVMLMGVLGIFSCVLIFYILYELTVSKPIALIGSTLFMISTEMIPTVRSLWAIYPVPFFTLLFFYMAIRFLRNRSLLWLIFFALSSSLMATFHPLLYFAVPFGLVWVWFRLDKFRIRVLALVIFILCFALVNVAPIAHEVIHGFPNIHGFTNDFWRVQGGSINEPFWIRIVVRGADIIRFITEYWVPPVLQTTSLRLLLNIGCILFVAAWAWSALLSHRSHEDDPRTPAREIESFLASYALSAFLLINLFGGRYEPRYTLAFWVLPPIGVGLFIHEIRWLFQKPFERFLGKRLLVFLIMILFIQNAAVFIKIYIPAKEKTEMVYSNTVQSQVQAILLDAEGKNPISIYDMDYPDSIKDYLYYFLLFDSMGRMDDEHAASVYLISRQVTLVDSMIASPECYGQATFVYSDNLSAIYKTDKVMCYERHFKEHLQRHPERLRDKTPADWHHLLVRRFIIV